MRITGGRYRGRSIDCPPGNRIRPALGRLREAIFSALGSLEDLSVLDLFAGTGALGIESISRGASFAAFVERDGTTLQYLGTNIHRLGLEDRTRIYPLDVYDYLSEIHWNPGRYQVAFLDPPYGRGHIDRLLDDLDRIFELADVILVKHSVREETETLRRGEHCLKVLKRGDDRISILRGGI